ncbi:MAG: hypothetical protein WCO84_02115 [bacterium]
MYLKIHEDDGCVTIIARDHTKTRLKGTCFRGPYCQKAGNFFRWHSLQSLFRDELVKEDFLTLVDELWDGKDLGTHSTTIEHDDNVGWESTVPANTYPQEELEKFQLNKGACALRVKPDPNKRAPVTNFVTIVFDLETNDIGYPVVIIQSVYPGFDVGELSGNVTEREGRVFFDWNYPGEETAQRP